MTGHDDAQSSPQGEQAGHILDTAAEEFARMGFDGARMDRIAELAGVNKATIYYHVGGKKALYHAVLDRVFANLTEGMRERVTGAGPASGRMRGLLESVARIVLERKYFSAIVVRELPSGFREFPPRIVERINALQDMYVALVEEGKADGSFAPGFQPFIGFMMFIGGLHMSNLTGRVREAHPGGEFSNRILTQQPSHEEAVSLISGNMMRLLTAERPSRREDTTQA
jgi:AcrR family transcriptional regulator